MRNFIFIFFMLWSMNSFSQKKQKDTLFIKYDNSLIKKFQHPNDENIYYKIKGTGLKNSGFVFLQQEKILYDLNCKKSISLKKVLKNSNAYWKKDILDDMKLGDYLLNYVIILKNKNKYIKVLVGFEET